MENFPATIVYGEDNTVYIQDILSTVATGNYVKGIREGNKIICASNQTIDYYPEYGYGINIGVLETEIKEDVVDFYYDPDVTEFSFILGDDGSLTLDLPGEPFDGENPPQYVIGIYYSDELEFIGYCDYYQKYEPTALQQVTMPKDAEVNSYVFVDEYNFAKLVDVAYYGNKLYIQGLTDMLPEATIVATIDGDKAYVTQNEYLGIYFDQFFIVTKVLYDNPDYDENDYNSDPYILAPGDAVFTLNIDPEGGIITADEDGVYLSLQPDEESYFHAINIFGKFSLKLQAAPTGTPANPVMLEYHTEWAPYQGFNDFMFTLSNFSTEGNLLDTETLYYKIYIDGEPLIFEEEIGLDLNGNETVKYQYVPDQQIFMVYEFNNNNDIFKFTHNSFDIGIYYEGITTIGVQSMYMYNNTFTYSEIVTLNVETGEVTTSGTETKVEEFSNAPIERTEYFTLTGIKVQNPGKGIYLIKDYRKDGKVIIRKMAL